MEEYFKHRTRKRFRKWLPLMINSSGKSSSKHHMVSAQRWNIDLCNTLHPSSYNTSIIRRKNHFEMSYLQIWCCMTHIASISESPWISQIYLGFNSLILGLDCLTKYLPANTSNFRFSLCSFHPTDETMLQPWVTHTRHIYTQKHCDAQALAVTQTNRQKRTLWRE